MNPFCTGSLSAYENFVQVGEGTYGYVFRANRKGDGEIVALKKLIFHKEMSGFPISSVREIKFLKSLQHKNIVMLKDIVTSKGCEHLDSSFKSGSSKPQQQAPGGGGKGDENANEKLAKQQESALNQMKRCGNLYLVFEYIEHDLGGLIDAKYKFSPISVKCVMKQLFEVLDYLSEKKILHRDIKSSNILISNLHQVKLADFGLARTSTSSDGAEGSIDLTNNVITMWYKPPELLLGAQRYSFAVDMWSVGCVFAELELGRPLFPCKSEFEQLDLICKTIGTPTEDNWQNVVELPHYESILKNISKYNCSIRQSLAGKVSDSVVDLLERILVADPARRTSAKIALTNKFFNTYPLPPPNPMDLEPLQLPAGTSLHEYETKQRRKQKEEESRREAAAAAEGVVVVPQTVESNIVDSSASSSQQQQQRQGDAYGRFGQGQVQGQVGHQSQNQKRPYFDQIPVKVSSANHHHAQGGAFHDGQSQGQGQGVFITGYSQTGEATGNYSQHGGVGPVFLHPPLRPNLGPGPSMMYSSSSNSTSNQFFHPPRPPPNFRVPPPHPEGQGHISFIQHSQHHSTHLPPPSQSQSQQQPHVPYSHTHNNTHNHNNHHNNHNNPNFNHNHHNHNSKYNHNNHNSSSGSDHNKTDGLNTSDLGLDHRGNGNAREMMTSSGESSQHQSQQQGSVNSNSNNHYNYNAHYHPPAPLQSSSRVGVSQSSAEKDSKKRPHPSF